MATRRRTFNTRYFHLYNLLSTLLWGTILGRTILLLPLVGATQLHAALGSLTKWTVTLSLLSFTVPSPKALSRLFLVWGVCDRFNASQDSTAYTTMLLAWSAMEVCRYAYYLQPRMRWVRYNVRYVADPIAVASEAWCIFRALPEAAEEGGGWYYWCLVVALAGYVPGLARYRYIVRGRTGRRRRA